MIVSMQEDRGPAAEAAEAVEATEEVEATEAAEAVAYAATMEYFRVFVQTALFHSNAENALLWLLQRYQRLQKNDYFKTRFVEAFGYWKAQISGEQNAWQKYWANVVKDEAEAQSEWKAFWNDAVDDETDERKAHAVDWEKSSV